MLAILTCFVFRGLFLTVTKLEVMLHYIRKALWSLSGAHHMLLLMAALLLQVEKYMPRVHILSTVLQCAGQLYLPESRSKSETL